MIVDQVREMENQSRCAPGHNAEAEAAVDYEVVIAGGGVAGMQAALMLGRASRRVLVVDAGQPRNSRADAVHGFITRDGAPPEEMYRIARTELEAYPTVETLSGQVTEANRVANGFAVNLSNGTRAQAQRLVLATGRREERPDVEGFDELLGHSIGSCPYCHGYESRNQPLAVLGGSLMSVRLALHLKLRFTDDVVMCSNGGPPELDDDTAAWVDRYNLDIRQDTVVRLESKDGALTGIVFDSGETLARTGLFVKLPLQQTSNLAEQLGCELLDDGSILVDDEYKTTATGVYAAGDAAAQRIPGLYQVIFAAADGAAVGFRVDQDLLLTQIAVDAPTNG